jgi:hypothetical protein
MRAWTTASGSKSRNRWLPPGPMFVTQLGHRRQRIGVRHKRDFSGAVVRWFTPKADRAVTIILCLA